MATATEIKAKYKTQHDQLSASYYAGTSGLTKQAFDLQHGKIWNDMNTELIAAGFIIVPIPPTPPRDLTAEVDNIKASLTAAKIPIVTAPVGTL